MHKEENLMRKLVVEVTDGYVGMKQYMNANNAMIVRWERVLWRSIISALPGGGNDMIISLLV